MSFFSVEAGILNSTLLDLGTSQPLALGVSKGIVRIVCVVDHGFWKKMEEGGGLLWWWWWCG